MSVGKKLFGTVQDPPTTEFLLIRKRSQLQRLNQAGQHIRWSGRRIPQPHQRPGHHPTQSPTATPPPSRPDQTRGKTTPPTPILPVLSSPSSRLPRAAGGVDARASCHRQGESLARGARACHLPPRPCPCSLLPIAIAFAGAPLSLELSFPVRSVSLTSCSRLSLCSATRHRHCRPAALEARQRCAAA